MNLCLEKNPSLTNSRFLINQKNREDNVTFDSSKNTIDVLYDKKYTNKIK